MLFQIKHFKNSINMCFNLVILKKKNIIHWSALSSSLPVLSLRLVRNEHQRARSPTEWGEDDDNTKGYDRFLSGHRLLKGHYLENTEQGGAELALKIFWSWKQINSPSTMWSRRAERVHQYLEGNNISPFSNFLCLKRNEIL